MASSGMDFLESLNSSMASSANTYAQSKAGGRAELQKELDKTDRDISRLTRLLRSPSSRQGVALGSLTQLYSSQSKLSDSLRTNMMNEQEKARKAVEDLRDKNDASAKAATTALEGNTANATAIEGVGTNLRNVPRFLGSVNTRFDSEGLEGNARILAYSILAQRVAGTKALQKEAILTEIRRATAKYLNDTQPSLRVGESVDPIKWAQRNVPIIYEDSEFEKRLLIDPAMQRDYLNGAITVTKPNDDFVDELRGLIRSQVMGTSEPGSASAASSIQIAEVDASTADKQASLDKVFSGALVLAEDGATINIKAEASDKQKASAQQVIEATGGTYTGFSAAVRGMKAQPGSEGSYLESVKSELSALKTRRDAQVTALSKSPRLSTGKMALLDHPILRVAGFREAPPMRLLKRAGRPEQPAVAAAAAAPVAAAAAGDEGVETSGVPVTPGVVNRFEVAIEEAMELNSKGHFEPENSVKLNDLAEQFDGLPGEKYGGLPDQVKARFPKMFKVRLASLNADDFPTSEYDDEAKTYRLLGKDSDTRQERLKLLMESLQSGVGVTTETVSDYVGGLSGDRSEEALVKTGNLLEFLKHGDSVGSKTGTGTDEEYEARRAPLGTFGNEFYDTMLSIGEGTAGSSDLAGIIDASSEFKSQTEGMYDPKYGTYPSIERFQAEMDADGGPLEDAPEAPPPTDKATESPYAPGKDPKEYLTDGQRRKVEKRGAKIEEDRLAKEEDQIAEGLAATESARDKVVRANARREGKAVWDDPPEIQEPVGAVVDEPMDEEDISLSQSLSTDENPTPKPAAAAPVPVPVPPAVESPTPAAAASASAEATDQEETELLEESLAPPTVEAPPEEPDSANLRVSPAGVVYDFDTGEAVGGHTQPPITSAAGDGAEVLKRKAAVDAAAAAKRPPPVPTAASTDLQLQERLPVETLRGNPGPALTAASPEAENAKPSIVSEAWRDRDVAIDDVLAYSTSVVDDAMTAGKEVASNVTGWLESLFEEPVADNPPATKVPPQAVAPAPEEQPVAQPDDPTKNNASDIVKAFPKNAHMSTELANEIVAVSNRLGLADPAHLANLINAESGFDPEAKNPAPNSTATGLIQMIETSALSVGTITDELSRMTAVDQMPYVEKYLKNQFDVFGLKNPTDSDLLAAVFYPAAMRKGDDFELYQDQSPKKRAQTIKDNKGIKTFGDYKRRLGKSFVMKPKT